MERDYNEIICTAIDEIVTARLQGLQYDVTKLCTIIDDTSSYEGKYIVSDGSVRFEAFSADTSYKKGNSVLVLIPNGNYNMQKTITSRVAATDTTPFNYTSPMDTMIKITDDIFDNPDVQLGANEGLVANQEKKATAIGPIYSIDGHNKFTGFTRLGITADFRSWLSGLDVVSGSYGIKVFVYTDILDAPGSTQENAVYELTFSSADMVGNPYQFEAFFYQEKVFDISMINNINHIDVYFYQDGQFKNGSGGLIPWFYNDGFGNTETMPANLFVKNVKVFLGYEKGRFTDETLLLSTPDALSYHYTNEDLTKTVELRWINKVNDNEFRLLDKDDLGENFELRWFKYHRGIEEIDQYAGKDWELVTPTAADDFIYQFEPDIKRQQEQIKAIGLITETIIQTDESLLDDNEEYQSALEGLAERYDIESPEYMDALTDLKNEYLTLTTTTPYTSDLIIFENEEQVPDALTVDAASALSIVFLDGSEGNYFLYDQNGSLIDEGQGQGYIRTVEARYYGAAISQSLGTIDYLKWYFPDEIHPGKNAYTMIISDLPNEEISQWEGTDYMWSQKTSINEVSGILDTAQTYSIKNQYNLSDANNTIRCVLSINGVQYEATKELLFGKAGTNGSNATFVLNFAGNNDALIMQDGATIDVKAQLFDMNNSRVGFTSAQAKTIAWSWFKEPDSRYIDIQDNQNGSAMLTFKSVEGQNYKDNYYILKATYNNGGLNLEAYLPIPLKRKFENGTYTQFEGAKQIIYDHQGRPTYYPKEYKLHQYDEVNKKHEEVTGIKWVLTAVDDDPGLIPQLKRAQDGYFALSASPFYMKDMSDKVCVSCLKINSDNTETLLWAQPILIMQSNYDFAMLNQWDGSLTIDEENGTILSTMLGAGRKNSNNTFSGVLIGDIQGGTELNGSDTQTGVYGLHEGVISYALKEDGTATFGKPGRGQIKIDGNEGTIQSASFNQSNSLGDIGTGLKLDLDDGKLEIKDTGKFKIQINPEAPYLKINGEDGLTPLINIGESDYYLQSYTYGLNEGSLGTHLNLADGSFNIKGSAGAVSMSGDKDKDLFKITNKDNLTLIEMDNSNNYYLQSAHYLGQKVKTITTNGLTYTIYKVPSHRLTIKNGSGQVQFNSGYVGVINSDVYKTSNNFTATSTSTDFSKVNFASQTTIVYTQADAANHVEKVERTYSAAEYAEWFISALIPVYENTSPSGLKIDLNAGSIHGYDLYLRGINSKDSSNIKTFTLDSGADEFPMLVGNNFKVAWDGSLTCNKLTSLTDTGEPSEYIINIGNNFKISPGGGASGNGVRFGGSFGGYCSGTGVFKSLTVSEDGTTSLNGTTTISGTLSLPMNVDWKGKTVSWWPTTVMTGVKSVSTTTAWAYSALSLQKNALGVVTGWYNPGVKQTKFITGFTITFNTKTGYFIRTTPLTENTVTATG